MICKPAKKRKKDFQQSDRVIVSSFALLVLAGTVLLMLPFSSKAGHITGPLEALFTATIGNLCHRVGCF